MTSSTLPKLFAVLGTASWDLSTSIVCTCSRRDFVVPLSRANLVLSLVLHASKCDGLCTAARFQTVKKILDAACDARKVLIACGTTIAAVLCLTIVAPSGPAPANAFLPRLSSMTYFSKLLFAVTSCASLCRDCQTPFSRPSICEEPTEA